MSCHSGQRFYFISIPLILLNSPRDRGLTDCPSRGQTYPLKSAGIVEFELENVLFSIKVKWSGGEKYFSPWSTESVKFEQFSPIKARKLRNREAVKTALPIEAAPRWCLGRLSCLQRLERPVCMPLVPKKVAGLVGWTFTKTEFYLFLYNFSA